MKFHTVFYFYIYKLFIESNFDVVEVFFFFFIDGVAAISLLVSLVSIYQ